MKEEAIKKINKVGKVGRIISKVISILLIIGLVGCVIGTIALFVIPSDTLEFETQSSIQMTINTGKLNVSDKTAKELTEDLIKDADNVDFADQVFLFENAEYSEEDNAVTVNAKAKNATVEIRDFAWLTIVGAVYLVVMIINFTYAKQLFGTLELSESPFTAEVISKIKKLAYSLIPWAVLDGLLELVAKSVMAGYVKINFSLNMMMVAIVLIVLFLAYIFQYGAELQQESDETL